MVALLPRQGETRTAAETRAGRHHDRAQNCRPHGAAQDCRPQDFGQVLRRGLDAAEHLLDCNQTSFAMRIGVPEQTLRGWKTGGKSPTFDRLRDLLAARFPGGAWRVPDAMVLDTLQTLAGARAQVTIIDHDDLPGRVSLEQVVEQAAEGASSHASACLDVIHRAADRDLCGDDLAAIARHVRQIKQSADRMLAMALKAAGHSGRRNGTSA